MRNGIPIVVLAASTFAACGAAMQGFSQGFNANRPYQQSGPQLAPPPPEQGAPPQQRAPVAQPALATCTHTRSGNALYTNCSDGSSCITTYNGDSHFTTCR